MTEVDQHNMRLLFHPMCGGCYHNIRRNPHEQIGFLCKACKPRIYMDTQDSVCQSCRFELDCSARTSVGAWMRCEIPDVADVKRLLDMEEFDEQTVRPILETALAGRGDRAVLEKMVSQVCAQICKIGVTGT